MSLPQRAAAGLEEGTDSAVLPLDSRVAAPSAGKSAARWHGMPAAPARLASPLWFRGSVRPPFNAETLGQLRGATISCCSELLLLLLQSDAPNGLATGSAAAVAAAPAAPNAVGDATTAIGAKAVAAAIAHDVAGATARTAGIAHAVQNKAAASENTALAMPAGGAAQQCALQRFEEHREAAVAAVLLEQSAELARHLPAFLRVVSLLY